MHAPCLTNASASALGYGDARGRIELRTALAAYLGRARGVQARPDQIMITAGATQALSLLASALAGPGRVIAMEDPGFAMHRPVVRQAGHRVVGMPVDDRGLCTDGLAGLAPQPVAVVVTPAHQYPTGVTLHPARRRALTSWARSHDVVIVEDDYDGEFRYERQPIGALQGTAPDQVVYVGTASKTLAPGLRLGWMVLPDRLVETLTELKLRTDLAAPTITQLTLAEMITDHGYDRHIRTVRLRYRRRRDLLIQALAGVGPDLVAGIPAGLQAPVRLPPGGPGEQDLIAAAAADGLALEGLSEHWHDARDRPQGLLIGFSKPSERAYPAAVALLAQVLRRMM